MISAKRGATIVGTLVVAFGTGFVMQNIMRTNQDAGQPAGVQIASVEPLAAMTAPAESGMTDAIPATPGGTSAVSAALAAAVPVPPAAAPQPERLPDGPVTLAALSDPHEPGVIGDLPAEEPAPGFGCELTLDAQPLAAAMVRLTLSAPCLGGERFSLHHNGMMFAAVTDDAGHAEIMVPALSEAAVFIATFASGASAVASAEVATLEYYDRAVVQWRGPEGLQIHALEYGADYGEAGHVWAGAARDMASAARGEGGFITRLGDPDIFEPMIAEIYTFPSGTALKTGTIDLSLEAEVTAANCGRDVEAQVLQKSGTQRMKMRELVLAMPACDAAGDYLVLKNLFDDLSIARN